MSASLAPECNEVKERYDTCFLKWYSEKYLRGVGADNNESAASTSWWKSRGKTTGRMTRHTWVASDGT
ncbi:hypothetical protein VD0002_g9807 [Verticillium dahliae]|nr:hypothetical protein VD0003_g9987 [Verticillium dahliae]PNH56351.1 hypothetical protein VD0002_g9807 [Verticillium dahliae]PNH71435.1 hypothetical protein VD0001_g6112 [Verticillium dahliae]